MSGTVRTARLALLLLLSVCLPAAGSDSPATPAVGLAGDPFPEYETIRGNVGFWTRIFGEWSLGQIVVHDLEYPAVIYAVVDLPEPREIQPYTKEQQEFIEDLRDRWEDRLETIERKVDRGVELDDQEKAIVLELTTRAGTTAMRDAGKRVRTQRGLRERFRRGLEISRRYDTIIRREFRDLGLPEDLAYMPHVESSFQVGARSSAGATGIWQFTRGTGKRYLSITSTIDERLDPLAATRGAAAYLNDAYDELRNWPIAMTAYNHGVAGMARAVRKHGRDYEQIFLNYNGRLFGFASKNFYSEFLAAREVARNVEKYFPEGISPEPVWDCDEIEVPRRVTAAGIAKAYGVGLSEIAAINPGWTKRAVESGHALPAGTRVWLPRGTIARAAVAGKQPELPPAPEVPVGVHVVRRGETLIGIADRYGMKLADLYDLNAMAPGESLIRAGQKLKIAGPDAAPEIHVVRRGDTMSGIALRYRMTVASLRRLNGMAGGSSLIRVGQKLRVRPGGSDQTHVVRRGETLGRIAHSYRVRLIDLLRVNSLQLHSLIHPGQRIQIPR